MRLWPVFAVGALYGLAMRLVFGGPWLDHPKANAPGGPMMASFVVLVPVLIGVFTLTRRAGGRRACSSRCSARGCRPSRLPPAPG